MSTIDERWNIVDTTRAFCQKVLPLVYDESLSYMELVCKVSSKLNEVIENNNNLPDYIKEEITNIVNNYLNSEPFKDYVEDYVASEIQKQGYVPEFYFKNVDLFGEFIINSGFFTESFCSDGINLYVFSINTTEQVICTIINLTTGYYTTKNVPYTGHFNSCAYIKDLNYIIAKSDLETGVVIINPEDMTIVKEFSVEYGGSELAYDNEKNRIITGWSQMLYFYDFNTADLTATYNKSIQLNPPMAAVLQQLYFNDNKFYFAGYKQPKGDIDDNLSYIYVYSIDGNLLEVISFNVNIEIEGAIIESNKLLVLGQSTDSNKPIIPVFSIPSRTTLDKKSQFIYNKRAEVYINSDYGNFYTDGSSDKPFLLISDALLALEKYNLSNIEFNVTGSQPKIDLVLRNQTIILNGGSYPSIKMNGSGYAELINANISGISVTYSVESYIDMEVKGCIIGGNTGIYQKNGSLTLKNEKTIFNSNIGILAENTTIRYKTQCDFNGDTSVNLNYSLWFGLNMPENYLSNTVNKQITQGEYIITISQPFSVDSESETTVTVSFPKPFKYPPFVIANYRTAWNSNNLNIRTKTVTASSVTFVIKNYDSVHIQDGRLDVLCYAR